MSERLHLFIAALSGRALAQAAHELGVPCTVADCFGDADTRRYAQAVTVCQCEGELRLDADKLLAAMDACASYCKRTGHTLCVITGTGFEGELPMLERLQAQAQHHHALCAFNSAQSLRTIADPALFFTALSELGANFPATQLTPPTVDQQSKRWWVKQVGGQGAAHIKPFSSSINIHADGIYYQEDSGNRPYSICAISNITSVVCLSMNEQQIAHRHEPGTPCFQYQGAIAASPSYAAQSFGIPLALQQQLLDILQQLSKRFEIRGLLSLDFMLHEGKACVLELNARPTATFELLNAAAALAGHLQAFGMTGLPATSDAAANAAPATHAGHRYVFAPRAVCMSAELEQALVEQGVMPYLVDWPELHSEVLKGAPLCNIRVKGHSSQAVKQQLDKLEHQLQRYITLHSEPLRMAA